jgi:hypothetical protein
MEKGAKQALSPYDSLPRILLRCNWELLILAPTFCVTLLCYSYGQGHEKALR